MKKKLKAILFLFLYVILESIFVNPVYAVCPLCTVVVAAGLGLSRYLGIDDSISGIWIGGLILSSSLWLVDWLKKKDIKFKYEDLIISALFYAVVIVPLWATGIIGHPFNKILGIDKLIFGIIVGTLTFYFSMHADKKVREIKGKQLFAYQKVVFPVVALAIISLLVYFYGGYLYLYG
jgi:hypothetical protein